MQNIKLTTEQRDIVEANEPFYIDADPGAGKTFVISERIRRMLESENARPFLLLTFTNAAVDSFRSKLTKQNSFRIDSDLALAQSQILTFDSFLNNYLARPIAANLWPDISPIFVPSYEQVQGSRVPTPDHGKQTVNIEHFEPDGSYKGTKMDFKRWAENSDFAKSITALYKDKFNEGTWSSKLARFKLEKILTPPDDRDQTPHDGTIGNRLLALAALRFPLIYVDEGQDCNAFEWHLLRRLQELGSSVSIIGDRKQAIYGFRDRKAEPSPFNSLDTEKCLPLRRSFRSNNAICAFADKVQKSGLFSKIDTPESLHSSPPVSIITFSSPEEYVQKLNLIDRKWRETPRPWTVLSHSNSTLDELSGQAPAFGEETDPAYKAYTLLLSSKRGSNQKTWAQLASLNEAFTKLLSVLTIRPARGSSRGIFLNSKPDLELARIFTAQALQNLDTLDENCTRADFNSWLTKVLEELELECSLFDLPEVSIRGGRRYPSLTKKLWGHRTEPTIPNLNYEYKGTIHSVKGLEFPRVSVVVGAWRPKGEDSLLTKISKYRDAPGSDETLNVAYVGITRAIHQVNLAFEIDRQKYPIETFKSDLMKAGLQDYHYMRVSGSLCVRL